MQVSISGHCLLDMNRRKYCIMAERIRRTRMVMDRVEPVSPLRDWYDLCSRYVYLATATITRHARLAMPLFRPDAMSAELHVKFIAGVIIAS